MTEIFVYCFYTGSSIVGSEADGALFEGLNKGRSVNKDPSTKESS